MKFLPLFFVCLAPFALRADVAYEVEEERPLSVENSLAEVADSYDQQYNMNPVPQSPRRTNPPGTCQDSAYVSQQLQQLQTQVSQLEGRVSALETARDASNPNVVPPTPTPQPNSSSPSNTSPQQ